MRKAKEKIKNCILKGTAMLASVTFIMSACCLDSESWLPFILCMVSMTWLAVFAYANGLMNDYGDEEW